MTELKDMTSTEDATPSRSTVRRSKPRRPRTSYADRICTLMVNRYLAGWRPADFPRFVSEGGWLPDPKGIEQTADVVATLWAIKRLERLTGGPDDDN